MNINEYRKLDLKTLKENLNDLRGKLFVLRFQISTGKTQKFSEIKFLKKEIARISTIISQKEYKITKSISFKKENIKKIKEKRV